MLRWLVLVLLLANAGYLAWSQHWLAGLGMAPATESEPERLGRQVQPEALRILPAQRSGNGNGTGTGASQDGAAAAGTSSGATGAGAGPAGAGSSASSSAAGGADTGEASATAATAAPSSATAPAASADGAAVPAPSAGAPPAVVVSGPGAAADTGRPTVPVAAERGECLQAGPFDTAEANAWRRAASALPQGSWSLERRTTPGRWMVYLGKFADADALGKKRAELRARNVPYDRAGVAALEPGLSLGRIATEEAADRALATLERKSGDAVRTARVVVERPEVVSFQLRLPLVDSALRAQLAPLRSALAGHALESCF